MSVKELYQTPGIRTAQRKQVLGHKPDSENFVGDPNQSWYHWLLGSICAGPLSVPDLPGGSFQHGSRLRVVLYFGQGKSIGAQSDFAFLYHLIRQVTEDVQRLREVFAGMQAVYYSWTLDNDARRLRCIIICMFRIRVNFLMKKCVSIRCVELKYLKYTIYIYEIEETRFGLV